MVLTKNEINRILETLPIGFYAKTKIDIECVDGSQSYYDESVEKIVIGVDTINMGLAKVADDFDTTVAVRTVLYHEVSHLILTPLSLIKRAKYFANYLSNEIERYAKICLDSQEAFDLINIVEDERIESALRNFYLNTNFRWFVTQQYNGEPFTTAYDIFYAAVRFRMGDSKILDTVSNIIIKYKDFSRHEAFIFGNEYIRIEDYLTDIAKLYAMCVQQNQDEQAENSQEAQNNEQSENADKSQDKDSKSSVVKAAEKENSQEGDASKEIANTDSNNNENEDSNCAEPESISDNDQQTCTAVNGNPDEMIASEKLEKLFNDMFNKFKNTAMTEEFRRIFKQFKTRGNVGGHTNAYSGVINPRNAARADYRYFTRTNTENNGGSGKLHLNLWIDCSGSYSSNELVTNQIIKSLETIERENKTFTFDVMDINEGVNVHQKNKRYIIASGGNYLCPEMDSAFKKMQVPDARNYNIVLYDGVAYRSGEQKLFSAWNHDNVYIISDTDNERPIRANCKKAKTLFVHWSNGKSYAEILAEKIYNVLRIGFGV